MMLRKGAGMQIPKLTQPMQNNYITYITIGAILLALFLILQTRSKRKWKRQFLKLCNDGIEPQRLKDGGKITSEWGTLSYKDGILKFDKATKGELIVEVTFRLNSKYTTETGRQDSFVASFWPEEERKLEPKFEKGENICHISVKHPVTYAEVMFAYIESEANAL